MVMKMGLMKIELPNRDVLLCDGGFVYWNGETYRDNDPVFGSIQALVPIRDEVANKAPDGQLILLPPSTSLGSELSSQSYQDSRIRIWIADIDEMSGQIIGNPIQQADLMIDTMVTSVVEGARSVTINFGSYAERFFLRNRANTLSRRFHRKRYPDEFGLDNANGVTIEVPFGTQSSAPRAVNGGGGGFSGRVGAIARQVAVV